MPKAVDGATVAGQLHPQLGQSGWRESIRRIKPYMDFHFYWAHPQFTKRSWVPPVTVDSAGSIGITGARGLAYMFAPRIFGKPFMVTEWDYANPNPHNVEGAFLTGAYAALQGYGGLCNYEYLGSVRRLTEEESPLDFFPQAVMIRSRCVSPA